MSGNQHVLVSNVGNGGISEFTASGVFVQTILPGTRVDWLDLAADQKTILYTTEGGVVKTADRTNPTAAPGTFSTAGGDFALRILPGSGNVLVANNTNVLLLNAAGAIIQTYDITGVDGFFALNLAPDNTSFWTGSFNTGNLYRFNIATGGVDTQTQTISTGCGSGCLFGVSLFGEITVANPLPEPSTLILVASGFAGFSVSRRRYKINPL